MGKGMCSHGLAASRRTQEEKFLPRTQVILAQPVEIAVLLDDSVQPRTYQLDYHGAWSLDIDGLRRATTDRTRAVVVVNPNNPTGSYLKCAELDALAIHCRAHGLALVGDEVFADYVLDADLPRTSSVLAQRQAGAPFEGVFLPL